MKVYGVRNYRSDQGPYSQEEFDDPAKLFSFLKEVSDLQCDVTPEGLEYLKKRGFEEVAGEVSKIGSIEDYGLVTKDQWFEFISKLNPYAARNYLQALKRSHIIADFQKGDFAERIDPCIWCGHSWDAHVLIGARKPPKRGIMFCPLKECDCWATWGIEGDS